jgi:hypothetical protein
MHDVLIQQKYFPSETQFPRKCICEVNLCVIGHPDSTRGAELWGRGEIQPSSRHLKFVEFDDKTHSQIKHWTKSFTAHSVGRYVYAVNNDISKKYCIVLFE